MAAIAVIGDFDAGYEPHSAISTAVADAQPLSDQDVVEIVWLDTESCNGLTDSTLGEFDAFWIAPGSPYKSLDGALRVIRYARVNDAPLLGTCGGFQHVALEYARNVLGFSDAQHAEYDPYASNLFIKELDCSLAGQSMTGNITPGTAAADAYGSYAATERYYCDFGLNPDYLDDFQAGAMIVSGTDANGEPRIIELPALRFFVATLFVPQTSSARERPHPLVVAFLNAASVVRSS